MRTINDVSFDAKVRDMGASVGSGAVVVGVVAGAITVNAVITALMNDLGEAIFELF